MFPDRVLEKLKRHAFSEYPKECCGLVIGGVYVPMPNVYEEPTKGFRIPPEVFAEHMRGGMVRAVMHSHPLGTREKHKRYPSVEDQQGQIDTAVTWGVVCVSKTHFEDYFLWGDAVPILPYSNRPFRVGVTDCFSLARDWYRKELGIKVRNFARDDEWWYKGDNMFEDHFMELGFEVVEEREVQRGDVALCKVNSVVPNHCGIVLENGMFLHHLYGRLSKPEPMGVWGRTVDKYLRYRG